MWTLPFSSRRVKRFQRSKTFSLYTIIWSCYLDIVDYFKELFGVQVSWERRISRTSAAMGKENYIWLSTRKHNISKSIKRMWYLGKKIWGFVSIHFRGLEKTENGYR